MITPIMINENMVDVSPTPGAVGAPPTLISRPRSAALTIRNSAVTAPGTAPNTVAFSDSRPTCVGRPGCVATITGELPGSYQAPLTGATTTVGKLRVENPAAYARTVFIEALARRGVAVRADPVRNNPTTALPNSYPAATRVAVHRSAPYAQTARLVLKVSLNLGANAALSLSGVSQGERTVQGAGGRTPAADRRVRGGRQPVRLPDQRQRHP